MALFGLVNNRTDIIIIGIFILAALSIMSTWFNEGITINLDTLKEIAILTIPLVLKVLNDCTNCPAEKFSKTRIAEYEQFKASLEKP